MKKLLRISAIICALALLFGMGFTTAFAAGRTETVLEDSFGNKNYEGAYDTAKWQTTFVDKTTIKQKDMVENQSLRFRKDLSGGEHIQFGTKNKIENIVSVEYSFMIPVEESPFAWVAISFVGQIDPTKPGSNVYDSPLILQSSIGALGNVVGKWVSVKIVPTSDTTADVWCALRNADGTTTFPTGKTISISGFRFSSITDDDSLTDLEKAEKTASKIQEEGWSFKNAHILWGCSGFGNGSCLDDIKITTKKDGEPEKVITNTFDSLDLDSATSDFKVYEGYRKASEAFEISEDGKMIFDKTKKGDRIISFVGIEADKSAAKFVKCLDVSFNVKIDGNTSDEVAFAFGLEDENADPTQNGCLYVIESDSVSGDAKGRFIEYKDGQILKQQQTSHLLEKVTLKDGADINIQIYKDGKAVVSHNGMIVSDDFTVSNYVGCLGFYSPKNNDGVLYIDNVFVDNSTYYVPVTKSVTHNFENDFFGNEGFEDFYMTSVGGEQRVENGKLLFDYCSDFSYFGSAYEYDGFILDYQISSIFISDRGPGESGYTGGTYPGTWFGLDIGRARLTQKEYGTHLTILLPIHPGDVELMTPTVYIKESVSPLKYNTLKWTLYKKIPTSLVKDIQYDDITKTEEDIKAEDALCVRFVSDAETGSIRLYLKKYGEAEFTLYYEVYAHATGYVALATTGFTTLKIDNFSMANTSPIYEIANNEAPETIYPAPEKEYIYTKPDVDVNLDEEIKLNLGGQLSWLWLVGGLLVGLGGLGAGFLMVLKAKKSTQQKPADTVSKDEGEA